MPWLTSGCREGVVFCLQHFYIKTLSFGCLLPVCAINETVCFFCIFRACCLFHMINCADQTKETPDYVDPDADIFVRLGKFFGKKSGEWLWSSLFCETVKKGNSSIYYRVPFTRYSMLLFPRAFLGCLCVAVVRFCCFFQRSRGRKRSGRARTHVCIP